MIAEFLDIIGLHRPIFLWLNLNWFAILTPIFLYIYIKTRNQTSLLIILEILISYFLVSIIEPYNQFLFICAQFLVYGLFVSLTSKNPIVSVSYMVVLLSFIVQYALDSNFALKDLQYESNKTMNNYNGYELAYNVKDCWFFIYHILIVPCVNGFMIKGLLSKGGGKRIGKNNTFNWPFSNSNNLHNSGNERFKNNNQTSDKRVKKT